MYNKSFYKGIIYTSLAALFWGIPQPLFFNNINFIPAIEIALHRGLWSFIFLSILIIISGKFNEFLSIFKSYRKILFLIITSLLISINWTGFIYAVNINRVQDASMGYFLTPIISILLGYFFLNEKISKLKIYSIIIMLSAILFLIISLKTFPLIALLIGITWGFYGLIRKQINIPAEVGLFFEAGFISIFALPYLIYIDVQNLGFFINHSIEVSIFLILTGAVTIFPLFFFNLGVKKIPLGFSGVIFFLAPSLHFITSAFILKEDISLSKLICFILIWIAVIIYIYDIIKKNKSSVNNTQSLN